MTSTHTHDPGNGPHLPPLPLMPFSILMEGTAELPALAADLPQPTHVTAQSALADIQFASERASLRAITRWALRFGAVVNSTPHQGPDGPQTICHTEFDYCGIAVTLYAFIPPGPSATTGTARTER